MSGCIHSISTVTSNGTDIFLLENHSFLSLNKIHFFFSGFPAKFIHTPIDFRENGWTHIKTIDPLFVCNEEIPHIPHIGFFDFDLHDQMLIGINFGVFLILVALWCVIFYDVGLGVEKLFRFVGGFCRKLFQK